MIERRFPEITDLLQKLKKRTVEIFRGVERQELPVTLSPEVRTQLKELVLRPNPSLAEFVFLGVSTSLSISEVIIANQDGFSDKSGLFQDGFQGSQADKGELARAWDIAYQQGKMNEVIVLGHSHPSGETRVRGITYRVEPSDYLLSPSGGSMGNFADGGDLAFFKAFVEHNPSLNLQYIAIVAITQTGPKVRLYALKDLISVKRASDLESVPSVTYLL